MAVNKPSGLLVHRSQIDRRETRFALQILRDQIGQRVFPVHRLDKPTSGVLLFTLNSDTARSVSRQIEERHTKKTYHAVVRGFAPERGDIDHPLKEELDKFSDPQARADKPAQSAQTSFHRLATAQLDIEIEDFPQSRYSLVECYPVTGRKHQIRRHMKHIAHPIIGDAKHGRGRHNRYFRDHLNAGRLLLHASQLCINHPLTQQPLQLNAPIDNVLHELLLRFDWLDALPRQWHYQAATSFHNY